MFRVTVRIAALCVAALFVTHGHAQSCSTIEVESGDSCGSLASECGISGNQFTQYNPQPNLCSTLQVGQHVCCTSGSNPYLPQENSDGSCATHQVGSGEYCSLIATNYSLTVTQLSNFNNNTWGWAGCDDLELDFIMCVSTGSPPMPAPVTNAECGPQVPGTAKPSDMSELAGLNPCPLNACCDKWGQCGTTSEFCTISQSSTGAPGTSAAGTNGCISNCGTDIVNNGSPPSEFIKVAYFEAWNAERPCMTMAPVDIDTTQYTHIHFAFGNVSSGSWDISASQYGDYFDQFKGLSGVKRIMSFGGWAFSTDPSTYEIFRQAMSPGNYETFGDNVVDFITSNGLDGVDFDWEYPGETDIPGIPASSTIDPKNYLAFLQYVRQKLPSDLSISIAAPASYWYLKGFPLADIASTISYVIFMTYDYHGQWDYQNTYADSGCPGGSCLRCHVNLTETMNSLSMITKAGVPSNKVIVGVANYARAFGMSDSSCTGPDCTFTGPSSGAAPGNCTQTAGYLSNVEIPADATTWSDSASDCLISTWGNTWAGYMDSNILASRTSTYQSLNMGGTTLWAVDLQDMTEGNANDTAPWCTDPTICPLMPWAPCTQTFSSLGALLNDTSVPVYCLDAYLIATLSSVMDTALANYTQIVNNDDYDKKFDLYQSYMQTDLAPDGVVEFLNSDWQKYLECPGSDWSDDGSDEYQQGTCGQVFDFNKGWVGDSQGFWNYQWTNQTGYWADLAAEKGILHDWCSIQNFHFYIPPTTGFHDDQGPHRLNVTNIPWPTSDFTVPNPKNIVQSALSNFTAIQTLLHTAALSASSDIYYVSSAVPSNDTSPLTSTIEAALLPVLMLEQAVQSMANVVEIGDKIEAAEREQRIKQILLDFFSAVFFVLPGIGEELAGLDLTIVATIGRMLPLVADLGNAGIDLYSTVQDPSNSWTLIFDALAVHGDFGDAADAFREAGLSGKIAKLGTSISDDVSAVKGVLKGCI